MAKASPIQTSFTAGELSPLLDGRVGEDVYFQALSLCRNAIPMPQGGVTRRPGTLYVGAPPDNLRARLIPFEFAEHDALVIVLTHYRAQFIRDRGWVESSPGVPYFVATPWPESDLRAIDYVQSADVLYMTHPSHAPRRLSRLADDDWTITDALGDGGPFMDEHAGTITVTASDVAGAITLTASAPIFQPGHVAALWLLWATSLDTSGLSPWQPGENYTAGARTYYNGRIYEALSTATSGTVPPTHEEGARWDGKATSSVRWGFESSLYGVVRITGVMSSTVVNATVLKRIPVTLDGAPTDRWAEGAWSFENGWPSCVAFFQDRLVFGGTARQPDSLWMSAVGDYLNFAPRDTGGLLTDDLAISLTVTSQAVNVIRWMTPDGTGLLCGTSGGEFLVAPSSGNSPLSQSNIRAVPQTTHGSAAVKPVKIGATTLFAQRSRVKLREAVYAMDVDRIIAPDATHLAPHMLASGVVDLAYQQEPHSIVWAACDDAFLAGLTYNRDLQIVGWHRHPLGGPGVRVESVTSIPAPDGQRDDLWIALARDMGGVTRRAIEVLPMDWRPDDDAADACFVDSARRMGSPGAQISGLEHLEGQTVSIWADGASHPDRVVTGGAVTLERAATKAVAGLACPMILRTMRIEAGAADGTAQGKTKRIHRLVARVFNTLGFLAGAPGVMDRVALRTSAMAMSGPVDPMTGDIEMTWPGGSDFEGRITIMQDQPAPFTLLALMPQLHTQDR